MGERGSWRSPRRIALVILGILTVVFLVGPMLVVIPMSFTEAKILSWPPRGFSLQWYQQLFDEPRSFFRKHLNGGGVGQTRAGFDDVVGQQLG